MGRIHEANVMFNEYDNQLSTFFTATTPEGIKPAISLTDSALKHLNKMRSERKEDLCLRIGVKQGGCSGMSYTMEFENRSNARPDDSVIEYNGFVIGRHHHFPLHWLAMLAVF